MAIALVTSAFAQGTSSGATTGAVNTTGATLLVLVGAYNSSVAAPTLSDSKSNTWTSLTAQATVSGSGQQVQIFYATSPTVGSGHTFSIAGASSLGSIAMQAFSGVKTSSPFDQQSGSASTSGAFVISSIQPGSVTPSEDGEVLVAGLSTGSTTSLAGAPSGYTGTGGGLQVGGTSFGLVAAYQVQGSATASNPTWSWTGANNAATVLATFKAQPSLGGGRGQFIINT